MGKIRDWMDRRKTSKAKVALHSLPLPPMGVSPMFDGYVKEMMERHGMTQKQALESSQAQSYARRIGIWR